MAALKGHGTKEAIKSLFVTLKRGFAGKKETHIKTLQSLGLKRREQCVEKPNNASIRGALAKVKHLVLVETDEEYNARMMLKRAKETTVQPPVHVRHDSMSHIHVESQDKL
mmetsp:Transcript_7613/g.15265  ORF Transcript_7613/g.15265 Transcript_7613/m.15265 type:complete len:111 (-) Transcript_7613:451-783(-)